MLKGKSRDAKRSRRANLMELSAPVINPVSEESFIRMGFEDNVGDDQMDQIDHGKNMTDQKNCNGEENGNSEDDLRDGNNNSSSSLFTETEILGRGRGLVAKVKLIAIIFLS